jgi:hypothetical protein
MATLFITEFGGQPLDDKGRVAPIAMLPPIAQQTVTFTTSTQSAVLNAKTTLVRIQSDANCCLETGTNPTATTAKMPLDAGVVEYFGIPQDSNMKIAAVTR